MFTVVMLILKFLRSRLYFAVDEFGPVSHLGDFFEDYRAVNGIFRVLSPAERSVVLAQDCRDCFIILVESCELVHDQMTGILLICFFDLFCSQTAQAWYGAIEVIGVCVVP